MMTELVLVEGVSDVQLISYYLQNVYGWKHEKENKLRIVPLDEHEHVESLSKNGHQLVLCGVGGNGRFAHFVERHHVNDIVHEEDIASVVVVTDRDDASDAKIRRGINNSLKKISVNSGQWLKNTIEDSFGQQKNISTYLLIVPDSQKGALERAIIDALNEIPEETELMQEVIQFVHSLKEELVPELNKINSANKATVGTFFSVRNPKNAMRAFGTYISTIDWSKSASLKALLLPLEYLGKEKPV